MLEARRYPRYQRALAIGTRQRHGATMSRSTADVMVVGAGIIGAAISFRLAEQGLKVVALDTSSSPATGSTGRSAAGARVQFSSKPNILLSLASIHEYRAFPDLFGEESGYRPIGYLFLVPPNAWEQHLVAQRLQASLGAPVHVLTTGEAQQLIEFDARNLAGATYGPIDGIVDPHQITLAYLRMARDRGMQLRLNSEFLSARLSGSSWKVQTSNGVYDVPLIVNAAGPWAGEVAGRAGLAVPVQPSKRMIFASAPLSWQHAYPLTIDLSTGFYLRSEGNRVLFGRSNPAQPDGFHDGMDWEWLDPAILAGMERFPWLEEVSLDRRASWWGYYEVTPDHNPIIGRMPSCEGWLNACGFSGHGVQQAAAVGTVVAEEVTLGKAVSIDIDELRISRFTSGTSNGLTERYIV